MKYEEDDENMRKNERLCEANRHGNLKFEQFLSESTLIVLFSFEYFTMIPYEFEKGKTKRIG